MELLRGLRERALGRPGVFHRDLELRETRRPPDYDRDRRREIRSFAQKADALAKELVEMRLRDEIVPLLEHVERAVERREGRT